MFRPIVLFRGPDLVGSGISTLWETDDGQYVIQGFTLDADALAQVGNVPDGELVIRVPKKLLRHAKDAHGATEL